MWRGDLLEIVLNCLVHSWLLNLSLYVKNVIGLRDEIRMADIEGAILYVNANKVVADIIGILLIVRFEGECLYCLPLLFMMVVYLRYLEI